MALGGTDTIQVPIGAAVSFAHPSINKGVPLIVNSGVHAIRWTYELNSVTTPTLGGEVTQVLSCFVGPMTIEGEAAGYQLGDVLDPGATAGYGEGQYTPVEEMMDIMRWFRSYFTLAGTAHLTGSQQDETFRRNESAVIFKYPARGWKFYIQPTDFTGYKIDREVVLVPWSITAEVVDNNALDYFEESTMSSFTESLTEAHSFLVAIDDKHMFDVNPFVNPALDPSYATRGKQLGDNFQRLVASWVSGDFAHWGFSALNLGSDNFPTQTSLQDIYSQMKTAKGTWIGDPSLSRAQILNVDPYGVPGAPGQATGGTTGTTPTDPGPPSGGGDVVIACGATQCEIVRAIVAAFEGTLGKATWVGEIAVATALIESTLSPDAANSGGYLGLFQNGITGGRASVPEAAAKLWRDHYTGGSRLDGLCAVYPIALQIDQAAHWFVQYMSGISSNPTDAEMEQYAMRAQGVNYDNNPHYADFDRVFLPQARELIKKCAPTCPAKGLSESAARALLVSNAQYYVGVESRVHYSEGSHGSMYNAKTCPPLVGDVTDDCSGFVSALYWQVGHDQGLQTSFSFADRGHVTTSPQPGDLVIWPNHIAIYIGGGNVVSHGQESGPAVVSVANENDYHNATGVYRSYF